MGDVGGTIMGFLFYSGIAIAPIIFIIIQIMTLRRLNKINKTLDEIKKDLDKDSR